MIARSSIVSARSATPSSMAPSSRSASSSRSSGSRHARQDSGHLDQRGDVLLVKDPQLPSPDDATDDGIAASRCTNAREFAPRATTDFGRRGGSPEVEDLG